MCADKAELARSFIRLIPQARALNMDILEIGEGIAVIAPDDGGDAVLRAFMPPTSSDAEAAVEAAFAEEDSRGRRLRCAEVTVDMSPLTKQPEQRFDDVATTALLAAARLASQPLLPSARGWG